MNYIRHLNAFFSFVRSDNRLTSSHVSLYLALFQYWNFNRFQNPFPVYRQNIMQISKIGSKNTYHKCLKKLHESGYIIYHPSPSKFQPVKISMLRLDIKEQETRFRQLDLFEEDAAEKTESLEENTGIKSGTVSVPDLTGVSPKIDTGTVSKMGHNIKLNNKNKNSVQNTPNKIFNKNEEMSKKINRLAGVSNMVHIPTLSEVQEFFRQNNYPDKEAQKFYLYNQGKNWMLTEKLAITDWHSLAHKWILNAKAPSAKDEKGRAVDIQYLYERLLEGEQISKSILIEHYEFLKLQLTEEIKLEALKRRINQLTGSNENSENLLLEAYQSGNSSHPLIIKDEGNFIALAKRVAVFNYLKKLQQEGKLNVIDKDSKNT